MSRFTDFLKNIFVPDAAQEEASSGIAPSADAGEMTRALMLDNLRRHFLDTMRKLTTDYSLAYHTSFVIYLRAANYDEMSAAFELTALDASKMLTAEVKKKLTKYPGYTPHSRFWQFQLVEIPSGAQLEGVDEDPDMDECVMLVKSTLLPPDMHSDAEPDHGRVVATMHSVSSMKALPKALSRELLSQLDMVERDKVRIKLQLVDVATNIASSSAKASVPDYRGTSQVHSPHQSAMSQRQVVLSAQDGQWYNPKAQTVFHTFTSTDDRIEVSGRNAAPSRADVVRFDSDSVMNPHVVIERRGPEDRYMISALGETSVNEVPMARGADRWIPLPSNSVVVLDGRYQFKFTLQ